MAENISVVDLILKLMKQRKKEMQRGEKPPVIAITKNKGSK